MAWETDDGTVEAYAWPFDQGLRDKADVSTLFSLEDPNLPKDEWDALLAWLAAQRLVFHNAPFDLAMLRAGVGCPRVDGTRRQRWPGADLEPAMVWDTMIVAKALDPLQPVGLKETATRLGLMGGDEKDKQEELLAHLRAVKKQLGLKFPPGEKRYDLADWDVMEPYATRDAVLTILLRRDQAGRIDSGEIPRQRVAGQLDVTRVLSRIERRGIPFDAVACEKEARKLRRRRVQLASKLPFTATIPGAKKYFFKDQKIEAIKTTPTGLPQLDDEVTRLLTERGVQWAEEWAEVTKIDKALSMWYDGYPRMIGEDGRLRTVFRQTSVRSGRVSVERIQLQAIPKDDKILDGIKPIRSMFDAKPGHMLINLDLQQAELRVATKMARCRMMAEMLEGGADIHGITTEEIFGIGRGADDFKVKRDIAKRLTFGGIFNIGAKTFQATLQKLAGIYLPLGDCDAIVKRWRGMYPEYSRMYYQCMNQVERQGWVELIGRERHYFLPGRDYPNTAWSRKVQGSLAKTMLLWLVQVEAQTAGLDALILSVHDSVVLELPEDGGWDIAEEVRRRGEKQFEQWFGTPMPIDIGYWHTSQEEKQLIRTGR